MWTNSEKLEKLENQFGQEKKNGLGKNSWIKYLLV